MFSNLEAVLFDLDGTLIDSSEVICTCFNTALVRHNLEPLPRETVKAGIGRPLVDLFTEEAKGVSVESLVQEYKRAFAQLAPGQARLLPGARELLEPLSDQKKLGVVTSRSSAGTTRILGEFGLLSCFSTLVGVEDAACGKPSPEPVLLALRNLGVEPDHSVFVGDTSFDMEAAKSAGSHAIGITTGSHSRSRLLRAGADLVVGDLMSLRFLIAGDCVSGMDL